VALDKRLFIKSPFFLQSIIIFIIIALCYFSRSYPLLATFGFESANFYLLFLSPLVYFAAALAPAQKVQSFSERLTRAFYFLLFDLAIIMAFLGYNALSLESCGAGSGLLPFLITIIAPLLLVISLGSFIYAAFTSFTARFSVASLLFFAYLSFLGIMWWHEGNFRLMSHFSLLIASDLMHGQELSLGIFSFRLASLCFFVALTGSAILLCKSPQKSFSIKQSYFFPGIIIASISLILGIVFHHQSMQLIGKSKSDLKHDYALSVEKNGIIIHANPSHISQAEGEAILQEALLYRQRISDRLGPLSAENLHIWLHKNDEEKFRYTGAKNVHFALPGHRELHISGTEIPHGVLGHELAHIYVGEYNRNFHGLPGSFGIPNFALTEGLAMLLSPELNIRNDLSMREQAQALYQSELNPDLDKLFSKDPIHFLSYDPRVSYIFSGAFLEFLAEKSGTFDQALIQKVISAGSIEALFSSTEAYKESIKEFHNFLQKPVAPYALLWVKDEYAPRSILLSNCKEENQHDMQNFKVAMLNEDITKLLTFLNNIPKNQIRNYYNFAIDKLMQNGSAQKVIDFHAEAIKIQPELNSPNFTENLIITEAFIKTGNIKEAEKIITSIEISMLSPSEQRKIIIIRDFIKAIKQSSEHKELYTKAILLVLAHNNNYKERLIDFVFALGTSSDKSSTPSAYAHYVLARAFFNFGDYHKSLALFLELVDKSPMLAPIINQEIERLMAFSYFKLSQYAAARNIFLQLLDSNLNHANTIIFRDSEERCAKELTHSPTL
jgi:tetratricopeptide (TPR) repeat protein